MTKNEFIRISTTILRQQDDWLAHQSLRRALPKAALLREAIELLKEKYPKDYKDGVKNE